MRNRLLSQSPETRTSDTQPSVVLFLGGNHRKNLVETLDGSLKRLGTGYVDLLYVHLWEYRTPIYEVMRALDDVVRAGKALYVAVSDTPSWVVSCKFRNDSAPQ